MNINQMSNMSSMNGNTTSMSASIQQVIIENNKGTRLIRQCQYDSAVKSFTAVLEILKPLAVIVEEKYINANGNASNADDDTSTTTTSSTPLVISFQNKSTSSSQDTDKDTAASTSIATATATATKSAAFATSKRTNTCTNSRKLKHFVVRDPIVIDKDESSSSLLYSPGLLSKLLMIVMYNLALTLHLQAISLASSTTTLSSSTKCKSKSKNKRIQKLFIRSKKLYELVLQMHLDLDSTIFDYDDDDDDDPLFTLALTNNLGLIYRTMNHKVQSETCFENMFSTMMYLLDSSDYSRESQSIKECTWDGLLSNAMDILFKHTYEVAAAAA